MPHNHGHFSATKQTDGDGPSGGFSPHARAVEVFNLQAMLPVKARLIQMVDYHELYMYVHPNTTLVQCSLAVAGTTSNTKLIYTMYELH